MAADLEELENEQSDFDMLSENPSETLPKTNHENQVETYDKMNEAKSVSDNVIPSHVIPSHNSIKDLYEKMIDWKIMARVNFL